MKDILRGKKILLVGGSGSVGCALAKDMLRYEPDTIRIFDISENEMFKMKTDFGREEKLRYLIGDIRDINRLKLAMEDIDIVVQLAAMKHVYACEYNPFEAIKTNIDGLQNVIDAARDNNVEKVIFTSTDKAASPSNVMGITKLLGEKLISLANYYKGNKKTIFSSVRFGNVVGSNGSVAPLFRKQIVACKPLTITDREMTRFIITMEEAVELIHNAIKFAEGGETFVWKMRTLKVVDLAGAMIERYNSGRKIKIEFIGKYEGEKTHEEIMSEEEISRAVELDNLYVIFPLIDSLGIERKHKSAKDIRNPVRVSNEGSHMSKKDINKLLESIEEA